MAITFFRQQRNAFSIIKTLISSFNTSTPFRTGRLISIRPWSKSKQNIMEVKSFVDKHLALLKIEKDAEIDEQTSWLQKLPLTTLQHKGICLSKVKVGGYRTGLYGRCIVSLESQWPGKAFPSHSLSTGDIAGIWSSSNDGNRKTIASGIITRISSTTIEVAFEECFEVLDIEEGHIYTVVRLTSDITFKRSKRALERLSKNQLGPRTRLVDVLFGNAEPDCAEETTLKYNFLNQNLNESQRQAVKMALNQKELAIIHGPPGTGKTTTVVESIVQFVQLKLKVLVCAPSNIAVDNLLEKLSSTKLRLLRLGHPARVLPSIQKYLLDSVLHRSEHIEVLSDLRDEIDKLTLKAKNSQRKDDFHRFRSERQILLKELRQREKTDLVCVLKNADVILATITGASEDSPLKHLSPHHFDVVVIDECSQAIEASCWIPLFRASKCLLAGDHLQLPPTIYSKKAADEGLAASLMERLVKMGVQYQMGKNNYVQLLNIQYRMHSDIMKWPSSMLYENKLIAHESVASHLLKDLPGVISNELTCTPLLLIDTAGCNMWELELEEEDSKGNEGEADLVSIHVEELIKSGLKCEDIAVIAPYNLQVELLRLRLSEKYPLLEIKSVDGFQGREKEAVVLSLVRSNQQREVGFLAEDRRINVAITRAKRHLAIICDSETVSHHPFLKSLVEYLSTTGEVWSANQFSENLNACVSTRPESLVLKSKTVSKSSTQKKTLQTDQKSNSTPNVVVIKTGDIFEIKANPTRSTLTDEEKLILDNLKREELERNILIFKEDKEKEIYKFPSKLTSFERMIVHELAEKYNIFHISEGDAAERHITLFKNQIVVSLSSLTSERQSSNNGTIFKEPTVVPKEENVAKKASFNTCPHCSKAILVENYCLHITHCENKKKQKKDKKTSKSNGASNLKTEDSDIDTILNETIASMNTCSHKSCKESVKLFGQICQFCKEKYCLSHHIAEVHGCGEDAKAHAKKVFLKDQIKGSKSEKKTDATKRVHLQRKLDKKLSELTNQRRVKKL